MSGVRPTLVHRATLAKTALVLGHVRINVLPGPKDAHRQTHIKPA